MDLSLWEYHEVAKMMSATTETGELNEYEVFIDCVFILNLAKGELEAVSIEEMDEIMQEIFENSDNNEDSQEGLIDQTYMDVRLSMTMEEIACEGDTNNNATNTNTYLDTSTADVRTETETDN
jgi:hypothetical protein